ncbi:MAG: aldo/keto reductase [Anaerolineales bacterium]|nr:aldo/keto reductase [Anaerolineales bacterium]
MAEVNHVRLGKNGVLVSNLCLGTMNFGWHTSEKESFAIMDRALELGIIFFDTADIYGWGKEHGYTEEIIGKWLAQGGKRREATVLATKVYNPVTWEANLPEVNSDSRSLSAYKIKKHVEGSLRRLQTDWIDIYQMHHIDRNLYWAETWQAFGSLLTQGKIVYVGSSNLAGWDIATANQEASKRGMLGLVSEQSTSHLNNRQIELEVIPACHHYGLGLIPWSPLDGGLLAGALKKHESGRRGNPDFENRVEENRETLEAYESLCRELGHPPAEVALAWLLHNPVVTTPIIGPRNIEQLESAVNATAISLDDETLTKSFQPHISPAFPKPMPGK